MHVVEMRIKLTNVMLWGYENLSCFPATYRMGTDLKREFSTEWEKIFTNPTCDRGLISKVCQKLNKLDIRRQNNPIKQSKQRILNRRISHG